MYQSIQLKPKKDESLRRFHPWVFSGALAQGPSLPAEGDLVRVFAADGSFLGVGHYQIGSIAVRILSFHDQPIDKDFYLAALSSALQLRKELNLLRSDNNTYRLVHGEGDHLPGLIIDIYGDTAVIQAHSVGMHRDLELIMTALKEVMEVEGLKHIYYKSEGTLPFKAELGAEDGYLWGGGQTDAIAHENGLRFQIDWLRGQKTGFFIDQRENRKLLEQHAAGRRMLNMFCYTGGFSVYGLRGGASLVDSVDSSSKAVSITDRNITLNFGDEPRHHSFSQDAFRYLKETPEGKYDLMVLDPPAFAKHRGAVNNALQGYKKLNLAAMAKIASGGILFSFSCSQAITREQFRLAIFSAAAISGRKVSILHQLSQPADHPINIYHPEGEYLKGLVLRVE
ncbi:MAG TPA: class I SAM-dependent rRNA methyltransferase [Proteiniphilum sp.]|nr:class I SAM-dependent rRNA methyltransferase [Proteiniphilum sp.]HPD87752.1 class I SAM-dependent rRNA methyltransferase [Proteiniphilum sp.]HPJ51183.1 class I SAM-dependent rRNA methyltransferase [Proteiniphilum sp.]HPR20933.1 class I SAM-dependent rRNA methyltransferase [Proteiniphilum sp.]